MAPFDRSHTSSYSSSIVTMTVSCTVFEIKRDIGRKTPIVHTLLVFNLHDPVELLPIFAQNFNINCQRPLTVRWCDENASLPLIQFFLI